MQNHTKQTMSYAICKKSELDTLVANGVFHTDGSVATCNKLEDAYTCNNPNHLFKQLIDYREQFKDEYTVIKVEVVTRVEYTISDTLAEYQKFEDTLRFLVKKLGLEAEL